MLTRVAIGLLAGTLLSAPVLAQTSPAPATSAPAGSSTAPAMNQSSGASMPGGNIQYITEGRPDMWRASQLDGVNVYNQNNERIGEIDDVLVDKQGKIEAVVIGVGGFLGIGERRVAVPFNALQWQMQEQTAANTGAAGTGTTTGTGTTAGTGGAGMGAGGTTAGTATAPATTGTVAGGQPAGGANTNAGANNNADAPARAILANATKDQLQQAPEFRYSR